MTRTLLRLSLLAYPRTVRDRDGDHLHDLALELSEENGVLRESLSLLRCGLLERIRTRPRAWRRAIAATVVAGGLAAGAFAAPALASPDRAEEEVFSCSSTADPSCTRG